MGVGALFAMTIPGLVVLLTVLATVDCVLARRGRGRGRRGALTRRHRGAVSAAGMDVFQASILPGRQLELDERRVQQQLREADDSGDRPRSRVDLARRVARIVPPS